jgi:SPP1 family predicted phage head-tail adaptor
MQAGKLPHHVSIQAATIAQNDHGEPISTWARVGKRWAEITPLAGNELAIGDQVNARQTHKIRIRNYTGLTVKHRILHGTRTFDINSIANTSERNKEMILMCTEAV